MEADSLWLQRSITVPDPLPNVDVADTERARRDAQSGSHLDAAEHDSDMPPSAAQKDDEHAPSTHPRTPPTTQATMATTPSATTTVATNGTDAAAAATVMPPPPQQPSLTSLTTDKWPTLRHDFATASGGGGGAAAAAVTSARTLQQLPVRYSTRASLSNASYGGVGGPGGGGNMQEYDDLRTRYMQAKRELLRLSDVQKDVEFARVELQRSSAEVQLLRESNRKLKKELDEATQRVDRERRARAEIEARMDEEGAGRVQEVAFLRQQVEELRTHNASRLAELTEQQENEHQRHYQALQEELVSVCEERDALARQVAAAMAEHARVTQMVDEARAEASRARDELAERQGRVDALLAQSNAAEERLQRVLQQAEHNHTTALDAQRTLYEERLTQVTRAKEAHIRELDDEVALHMDKCRALASEAAELRQANTAASDALAQATAAHTKELRRVEEAHRLALAEQQLQHEAALREAKGGRYALEEELQSLRRQLDKVSDELATLRGSLSQRDALIGSTEAELHNARAALGVAEAELTRLREDAAAAHEAAAAAHERVARAAAEKDALEADFTNDLVEARNRVRGLEEALHDARSELAALRTEHVHASDESHTVAAALRRDVDALTAQRDELQRALAERQQWQVSADEYRKRFTAERQKADSLNIELCAAIARCAALEKRLDDEQQLSTHAPHGRAVQRAATEAMTQPVPASASASPSHTASTSARIAARALRSASTHSVGAEDGHEHGNNVNASNTVASADDCLATTAVGAVVATHNTHATVSRSPSPSHLFSDGMHASCHVQRSAPWSATAPHDGAECHETTAAQRVRNTPATRQSADTTVGSADERTATPAAMCAATGVGLTQASQTMTNMSTSMTPPRPRMRSASSSNARANARTSLKRARTAEARVFAISGFDGNDLLMAIKQLPGAAIAECKSNMPVPAHLTHLVTNGQLTIKLLSALARGCWVLPQSYVSDSVKCGAWQNEAEYGFQHAELPLHKKRVLLTSNFMVSRHYSTAALLLKEGGAVVLDEEDEGASADYVLCTNQEVETSDRHISWEGMVDLLYPQRIE